MKKIEIITRPEKLEELKALLDSHKVGGMSVLNIMGCGNQKGIVKRYRGGEMKVNFLPKIRVETIVADEDVDSIIEDVLDELQTGELGDGKIAITDIGELIRVRTGERGNDAL